MHLIMLLAVDGGIVLESPCTSPPGPGPPKVRALASYQLINGRHLSSGTNVHVYTFVKSLEARLWDD